MSNINFWNELERMDKRIKEYKRKFEKYKSKYIEVENE